MTNNLINNQNEFMTKNHELVNRYLRAHHLEISEFYDVVIFGYIEAAKRYINNPVLQEKHPFIAVAFTKMNDCMSDYWKKQRTQKRRATVVSLDCCDNEVLFDPADISDNVFNKMNVEEMLSVFDKQEQKILSLLMDGYPERTIAKNLGISVADIAAKRTDIKNKAGLLNLQAAA